MAIVSRGGACVVQDFDDALHDSMPRAAQAAVPDAKVSPAADIATVLAAMLDETVDDEWPPSDLMKQEAAMADMDPTAMHDGDRPGTPSGFACPDCHGALFEIVEGSLTRYRCRVGHAWSAESLTARKTVDLESALWMALRSLEENHITLREKGPKRLPPTMVPMMLANTAPGLIAIRHGAGGPNYTLTSACASGAHAIGESAALIASGQCAAVITGGAEAVLTEFCVGGFCAMISVHLRPRERHRDDADDQSHRETKKEIARRMESGVLLVICRVRVRA